MLFQFFGYVVRNTGPADLLMLRRWTPWRLIEEKYVEGDAEFWLKQGNGIESFLVTKDEYPLGVFQTEHIKADQVRIHFQAVCRHPKKILRAITKLVPLIEQALRLRGVTAIFFTSHSRAMAEFMRQHHQYEPGQETKDGVVMAKRLERINVRT